MNITIPQHSLYPYSAQSNRLSQYRSQTAFCGFSKALSKFSSLSIDEYRELKPIDKFFLKLDFKMWPLRSDDFMDLPKSKYYYSGKGIFRTAYSRLMYKFNSTKAKRKLLKQVVPMHVQVVDTLKEVLDQSYGKGKYVFVTIGQSLSSVAKALSYRIGDENVIQIPMSNARRFCHPNSLSAISNSEIAGFNRFLESVGLTKDIVKKSGKKYIIVDYCFTGSSLDGAFNLLTDERFLGKSENLVKRSIKSLLESADQKLASNFDYVLDGEPFKIFSLVNKCYNLSETQNAAVISPTRNAREALFSILDNMVKKNIIEVKK